MPDLINHLIPIVEVNLETPVANNLGTGTQQSRASLRNNSFHERSSRPNLGKKNDSAMRNRNIKTVVVVRCAKKSG
jgi:hypothetical protein